MNKTIEVLKDAREILGTKGWCKGSFERDDGRCCLVGAINNVAWKFSNDSDHVYRAKRALVKEIAVRNRAIGPFPMAENHIYEYNDSKNRRKKDVIRLIDRTIRRLEKEASS